MRRDARPLRRGTLKLRKMRMNASVTPRGVATVTAQGPLTPHRPPARSRPGSEDAPGPSTPRSAVKTVGALLWEPGTHSGWSVEEIELDPPKRREVMVKLTSSGICHSDDHLDTGDIPLGWADRKSTRLNSSHANISYAVFCLKKKKKK